MHNQTPSTTLNIPWVDPRGFPEQEACIHTSVIVVAFNSQDYLRNCLDSLLQTLPEACEILLVDNASMDTSTDLVKANYPTIRLICSPENLGFAGGNNLAAKAARGEYLAFLNPDTITTPGWLDALVAPLQENPQTGMTTSKVLMMRSQGTINACGNDVHLSGITLCRGAGLEREALGDQLNVGAISGAAFAIRRELFEKLGGFDESFFLYMEDTDLSWRARLAGYDCIYVPASVVYHDYTLKFRSQKILFQERNRYRMLLKSLRWSSLLVLSPALLLAEVVTWGFVLVRQPHMWRQKLQAYAAVVRNRGEIMAARRQAQALRKRSDREMLVLHTWWLDFEQTGPGIVPRLAKWVFTPFFWVLKGLAWLLVWQ